MAASNLLSQLRRRRPRSFVSPSPLSHTPRRHLLHPSPPPPLPLPPPPSIAFFGYRLPISLNPGPSPLCSSLRPHHSRSFSTDSRPPEDYESVQQILDSGSVPGLDTGVVPDVVGGDEYILPVRAFVSMLDCYHDLAGLPWWIIIASSTLALRLVLLPLLVLQIKKKKRISELFPKLPPPFPPPLSGRSYVDQILLFRKKRKALGCPSFLWFLAGYSVQVPCFLLWMFSIRRMSLDHHPGFDCGGTLWFQNLTETPHGLLGPIFPLVIAGLHYTNVELSFSSSPVGKAPGTIGLLAKYYRSYLEILTMPIMFIGFFVPQGGLVYWLTNATLTVVQQVAMKNSVVLKQLRLPDNKHLIKTADPKEMVSPDTVSLDPLESRRKISVQNLSPQELHALSIKFLAKGQKDRAIPLLQLALGKDPEYVRAMIVMGQTLLQNGLLAEANEHLERAISKLNLVDHAMEDEDVDLLILASQWAGVSCIRQGRNAEGIIHLQRVANLKEPEKPKIKAHYFDGLLLLGSALYNEGQKAEAAKFLRMVVSYDPSQARLLKECEEGEDILVSDLTDSKR